MSATSVGQIGLDLVVNQNQFKKQMSGITSLAKKAGAALAAAFAVKKIADFGKQCLELGSDLQEVQNVVDVTFPHMSNQVDRFAKSAAQSFGLSETMAKRYTGTFGAMAKAFGFTEAQAYDMSTTLTGLAGDVASFYNISQDEAYTKLKSVFSGETETLKDLGIVMTQAALDQYALANGYGKTTQAMTEQEKVALRYAFVQSQLSTAQGDFARTSDSWANQTRTMSLQLQSIMATIGQGLINLFTPAIKVINSVLGKIATLANAFKSFTELLTGNKSSGGSGIGSMAAEVDSGLSGAADSAGDLADNTASVGSAAKKTAKEMRSLMGFDQINKLSEQDKSESGSGSSPGVSSGTSGAGADFGQLAQGETVVDKFGKKFLNLLTSIRAAAEPTVSALKRLWNEGLSKLGNFTWTALKDFYNGFLVPVGKWVLGEGIPRFIDALNNGLMKVNFQKINDALKDLWNALAPFAVNVGKGLLWFWENVLVPLGTWVANEVVPRFLNTLAASIRVLNSIIVALQPLFKWFWDNVLLPIAQWTGGIFLSIWDKINGILNQFAEWCTNNPEIIRGVTVAVGAFFAAWKVTELLSFIQQSGGVIAALKGIATAILGTTAAKVADKAETIALTAMYAKDFVVNLAKGTAALAKQAAQFLVSTAAKVADTAAQVAMTAATVAWNAACALATAATTALGAAFTFLTSPIGLVVVAITGIITAGVALYKNWDTVKAKAKETWEFIKQKFEMFDTFLQSIFVKDWSKSFGVIGDLLNGFFKNVSNIWNSIKKIFSGIVDFIEGVFSGDWKKAWKGVSNIFKGIWDGLVAIVKAPINLVIGAINGLVEGVVSGLNVVIRALNNLSFDVPDWVPVIGGEKFGFNITELSAPQIPYLAKGGYVKPNTPQLAMIGDNRHQGEVVAPEDKLQAMVDAAVSKASGHGGITREEMESIINSAVMRIVAALANMGFYLDGEQLARMQKMAQTGIDRRWNMVEVT